ncbi:MAG: hypothetical protein HN704_10465 [Bacteroidetes bacterium]|jgi:hypothetical protein|nr:hypothetical protein [Bacteroidota bacterium]MBT7492015.1 hypothetical protein [Bacteroidota bacterium]
MGCLKLDISDNYFTILEVVHNSLSVNKNSSADAYLFGFNGQEKDDEISGTTGGHTTAMFWEYDTRIGRRWNVDPKPNPSISYYSCFANNPIWNFDPLGDTIKTNQEGFNIINEGLQATLGANNPFSYNEKKDLITYNSKYDKSNFSDEQIEFINDFAAVVTNEKTTTVYAVDFNEIIPSLHNSQKQAK